MMSPVMVFSTQWFLEFLFRTNSVPTKYRKFDNSLGYRRVLYSFPAGVVLKVVITEKLSDSSYKARVLEIIS